MSPMHIHALYKVVVNVFLLLPIMLYTSEQRTLSHTFPRSLTVPCPVYEADPMRREYMVEKILALIENHMADQGNIALIVMEYVAHDFACRCYKDPIKLGGLNKNKDRTTYLKDVIGPPQPLPATTLPQCYSDTTNGATKTWLHQHAQSIVAMLHTTTNAHIAALICEYVHNNQRVPVSGYRYKLPNRQYTVQAVSDDGTVLLEHRNENMVLPLNGPCTSYTHAQPGKFTYLPATNHFIRYKPLSAQERSNESIKKAFIIDQEQHKIIGDISLTKYGKIFAVASNGTRALVTDQLMPYPLVYTFATHEWIPLQPYEGLSFISATLYRYLDNINNEERHIPHPHHAALADNGYVALSNYYNLGIWGKDGTCITWLAGDRNKQVGSFLPCCTQDEEAQLLYFDGTTESWCIQAVPHNRIIRCISRPSPFFSSVRGNYLSERVAYKNGYTEYPSFCLATQTSFDLVFPHTPNHQGWACCSAHLSPHARALTLSDIDASKNSFLDIILLQVPSFHTKDEQEQAFMRSVHSHEISYWTSILPRMITHLVADTFVRFIPYIRPQPLPA